MLRRLMNVTIVLLIGSFAVGSANATNTSSRKGSVDTGAALTPIFPWGPIGTFDIPVPWPWGLERPFPWSDVQGMWKVQDYDLQSYFVLKVTRSKDSGQRLLVVRQINSETCKVTATGVGYEANRVVRAQMTTEDDVTYRIAVRAFDEDDSPRPAAGQGSDTQVMVLSVMPLGADDRMLPIHVQIAKIARSIDLKNCESQKLR